MYVQHTLSKIHKKCRYPYSRMSHIHMYLIWLRTVFQELDLLHFQTTFRDVQSTSKLHISVLYGNRPFFFCTLTILHNKYKLHSHLLSTMYNKWFAPMMSSYLFVLSFVLLHINIKSWMNPKKWERWHKFCLIMLEDFELTMKKVFWQFAFSHFVVLVVMIMSHFFIIVRVRTNIKHSFIWIYLVLNTWASTSCFTISFTNLI